jgi:DNA-directed RNA polymerase subunit RPC12/RpoP
MLKEIDLAGALARMKDGSEKICMLGKNVGTDYDEVDQFVCSECGIELQGWYRVERDEDDGNETYHEYRIRRCPNCGAKVDAE